MDTKAGCQMPRNASGQNGPGWYSPTFDGSQCFGTWVDQSTILVPPLAIPDMMSPQLETDTPPKSPTSTSADSAESAQSAPPQTRTQTAGRAAKRQRGRERRKMHKALKRLESGFEERFAAVAAELKIVVKSTFVDVLEKDAESEVLLPAPFFKTTREIDQWRGDYRRFRQGHHRGARGEITSLPLLEVYALPSFDLQKTMASQPLPLAAMAA